jgi:hypothetical protein
VDSSRRIGTWIGAGVFAVLTTGLLIVAAIALARPVPAPGAAEPVNAPQGSLTGGGVCLLAGFTLAGMLTGLVLNLALNLDASPAGRTLSVTRGAFFGALILAAGLFAVAVLRGLNG